MRRFGTFGAVAVFAALLMVPQVGVGVAGATPDAPTVNFGASRATTAQRHSIQRLYLAYFLRMPDRRGHDFWSAEYSSGRRSLQAISQYFSTSDEFRARYGTLSNAQFVRRIYRNVLEREPDPSGLAHWVAKLNGGATRGSVMIGFSESPEFQRATGTVAPAPPAPGLAAWQQEMLRLVNAERSRVGARALVWCPRIANAATAHSADQARRNIMTHSGSDGSNGGDRLRNAGYRWSMWSENVAYGYTDVASVIRGWMTSGTHRTNLLDPDFVHIGVGRVSGSNGLLFWTQNFGTGGTC